MYIVHVSTVVYVLVTVYNRAYFIEHQFPVLSPRREPQGESQHTDHVHPGPSPWEHAPGRLEEPVGLPADSLLGQAAPRVHG